MYMVVTLSEALGHLTLNEHDDDDDDDEGG
jgi:hypothetical protein